MDNVNEMDIVRSASTMNRLRYQATGLTWERKSEGGATSQFDTTVGTELNDLKVEIKYKQDLHGYDNPWPAGGGKNKYNGADIIFNADASATTLNGIALTKNSDGSFTVEGTATAETRLNTRATYDFKAGKSYTISIRGLTNGNIRIVITGNPSTAGIYYTSVYPTSDFSKTFTITADCGFDYFFIDVQNGATVNNTIRVQIEEGQLTEWTPYSNICPITGYDEAMIYIESEYDAESVPRCTIDLDDTRYAGTLDVTTGDLTDTYGEIESYDGEELPGIWVSSLDAYAEGATPTTGAQVIYELAEPITVQIDPTTVTALTGHNVIWCNTGNIISVDYNIT